MFFKILRNFTHGTSPIKDGLVQDIASIEQLNSLIISGQIDANQLLHLYNNTNAMNSIDHGHHTLISSIATNTNIGQHQSQSHVITNRNSTSSTSSNTMNSRIGESSTTNHSHANLHSYSSNLDATPSNLVSQTATHACHVISFPITLLHLLTLIPSRRGRFER